MKIREFVAATIIGVVITVGFWSTDVIFKMAHDYNKLKNAPVIIDLEIECRVCKTINYVHMHNAKEEAR